MSSNTVQYFFCLTAKKHNNTETWDQLIFSIPIPFVTNIGIPIAIPFVAKLQLQFQFPLFNSNFNANSF